MSFTYSYLAAKCELPPNQGSRCLTAIGPRLESWPEPAQSVRIRERSAEWAPRAASPKGYASKRTLSSIRGWRVSVVPISPCACPRRRLSRRTEPPYRPRRVVATTRAPPSLSQCSYPRTGSHSLDNRRACHTVEDGVSAA